MVLLDLYTVTLEIKVKSRIIKSVCIRIVCLILCKWRYREEKRRSGR